MLILGIESSCDDTSLSLLDDTGVIDTMTAAQLEHDTYGGVVPELASRQHMKSLMRVFAALLERNEVSRDRIDAIGVSNGPGLVGSLLVGTSFAKGLALTLDVPVVGVHHIEAHILSNELNGEAMHTPNVTLVVSGGHTSLFVVSAIGRYQRVGNTRDDAAGEAFDKIAKLLGLGFPGGPAVQAAAEKGNPKAIAFPRAMMDKANFDFSFSGLKTAVRVHLEREGKLNDDIVAEVCASAQAAIVEVLVRKTIACAQYHTVEHVYLAGGVAANRGLRDQLRSACESTGLCYHAPLIQYCTDNGAMVAQAASHLLRAGRDDVADLDVFARGAVKSWA